MGCRFELLEGSGFGLLMHVGTADKASKTECMYYPPHRNDVITADDTAAVAADEEGSFVTFTDSFKYLGSRIDCDLHDKHDVCSRIKSATGAFGALRKPIFENKHISFQTKKVVYVTLIINIALYGAECWCLTEDLLARLRAFHHRCIRVMCGVTRWHVWRHHIRNAELRSRLRLETIDVYIWYRQLRWAGHVARMGHERFPRKFLTSWAGSSSASAWASSVHIRPFVEQDAFARGLSDGVQGVDQAGAGPRLVAGACVRPG